MSATNESRIARWARSNAAEHTDYHVPHAPETVPALGATDVAAAAPPEVPTAFWTGYQGGDKNLPRTGLEPGGSVQDLLRVHPGWI
ncbi:hypothetical protein [Streptomyces coffeae]|uniref:Uncharacterized protein n=1 Tax=Streptomyces coffeae TaxID=621382 RepID=A0ABS1NKG2_9ACTN|nr:hypothetical protein [Streptomyces coffeae]MBL1100256.1 hypothetical protein [Streptomyces coffeae]